MHAKRSRCRRAGSILCQEAHVADRNQPMWQIQVHNCPSLQALTPNPKLRHEKAFGAHTRRHETALLTREGLRAHTTEHKTAISAHLHETAYGAHSHSRILRERVSTDTSPLALPLLCVYYLSLPHMPVAVALAHSFSPLSRGETQGSKPQGSRGSRKQGSRGDTRVQATGGPSTPRVLVVEDTGSRQEGEEGSRPRRHRIPHLSFDIRMRSWPSFIRVSMSVSSNPPRPLSHAWTQTTQRTYRYLLPKVANPPSPAPRGETRRAYQTTRQMDGKAT